MFGYAFYKKTVFRFYTTMSLTSHCILAHRVIASFQLHIVTIRWQVIHKTCSRRSVSTFKLSPVAKTEKMKHMPTHSHSLVAYHRYMVLVYACILHIPCAMRSLASSLSLPSLLRATHAITTRYRYLIFNVFTGQMYAHIWQNI